MLDTNNENIEKSNVGRPLFDGKDYDIVIQKLEQAWSLGCSDKDASFFSGISPAALSDFLKKNPDISERKEELKTKVVLKAKQELIKGFENNPEICLKYLERKRKDEYSTKTETDITAKIDNKIDLSGLDIETLKSLTNITKDK